MPQENSVRNRVSHQIESGNASPPASPCANFSTIASVSADFGVFSRAIVVEAPGYTERRALHSACSVAAHVLAVLAIIWFWPLAFPEKPILYAMSRQFVALPLSLSASAARPSPTLAPRLANPFLSMKLTAPVRSFTKMRTVVPPPPEIPPPPPVQIASGFGAVLGSVLSAASQPPVTPALPLDIPSDAQVFRAGGDIRPSRLIERVSFDYPEIAKMAHVFGSVVIAAVIDETGKVTQARLVSGPGLLAYAAIEQLSRERFQPTMLDGQPTKCDLLVHVTFHLRGWEEERPSPW
jgi:hypothetical protein